MQAKIFRHMMTIALIIVMAFMVSQVQAIQVQLDWTTPLVNVDGTPLTDLAGHKLYWSQDGGDYEELADLGVQATSFDITISECKEGGTTYDFAVTAYDFSGNESDFSNQVSTTIPLPDPNSNACNTTLLPIQSVSARSAQSPNVAANTLDGDVNTRWSAEGDGQWIEFDLGATNATVNEVAIAWFKGDQRQTTFTIEMSTNGTDWMEALSSNSSGNSLDLETYDIDRVSTRYVRIIGYGNSTNLWNSITEVELYGQQENSNPPDDPPDPTEDDPTLLSIQSATASDAQSPNVAANTLDGDLATRWSANGNGRWIMFELTGTNATVSEVDIAWFKGNQRQSTFTIEVSTNGTGWTEVFSGTSSGKTLELQAYTFTDIPAQYLRIVGYGNSANSWNSITEVDIYGTSK